MKRSVNHIRHYFRTLLSEISIEELIANRELIKNAELIRNQLSKASL